MADVISRKEYNAFKKDDMPDADEVLVQLVEGGVYPLRTPRTTCARARCSKGAGRSYAPQRAACGGPSSPLRPPQK